MSSGTTTATFDWWGWLAGQGIAALCLGALAYFVGTSIVIPMRNDQTRFMDSVIETNKQHAGFAAKQTEIQAQQAMTLTQLVRQQDQTTLILQQIRDDQRRGAWLDGGAKAKQ